MIYVFFFLDRALRITATYYIFKKLKIVSILKTLFLSKIEAHLLWCCQFGWQEVARRGTACEACPRRPSGRQLGWPGLRDGFGRLVPGRRCGWPASARPGLQER